MWITTSKNADEKVKSIAQQMAQALPGCRYAPRSERPLAKMDRIAQKAGCASMLVLGKSSTHAGKLALLSRRYVDDGDTCMWMWQPKFMDSLTVFVAESKWNGHDEPLEYARDASGKNDELAAFFGYNPRESDAFYEKITKVEIEGKKGGAKIKVGGKPLMELNFAWKKTGIWEEE